MSYSTRFHKKMFTDPPNLEAAEQAWENYYNVGHGKVPQHLPCLRNMS